MAGDFLFHYNLFLPRYRSFTIVEGGLLAGLLVAALVAYYRLGGGGRFGRPPSAPARGRIPAIKAGLARLAGECPETFLLLLFAAPYPVMILVLYPRHHYVLMTGASLLAFAFVAFGRQFHAPPLSPRKLLVLPLLLALVPSLGSVGVLLNRPHGEVAVSPRPALAEALFLRRLKLSAPINLLEASDPGISPYVAPNFRSVSTMEKPNGLAAFLRDGNISIVLEDDRLRLYDRFSRDPEWAEFRSNPRLFGFEARPVPDAHAIVYVKQGVMSGVVPPTSGISS
jgi:hypothetical protein